MLKKLLKILYILIPLVVILVFFVDLISYYSNIAISPVAYIREIVIFAILFLSFHIIKNRLHYDELSIQQNILYIAILIGANFLLAIIINILFDPSYGSGFPPTYGSTSAIIASSIFAILAALTFVPAIFILKQLIFYKRKRNTAIIFNLFLLSITINAVSVFITRQPVGWFRFSSDTLANDISFIFTIIFILILSFRNEWITHLTRKKKIIYFFLGIPLYAAIASLFDFAYRSTLPAYSLSIAALTYGMWLFLVIYGGIALFKLLFHLPTARAFDRKMKELNSLYDLGRMLNSETKIEKLLPLITQSTSDFLEGHSTWLSIFNAKENSFNVVSSLNLEKEELDNSPLTKLDGLNKHIVNFKEAYLINDVSRNRQFKELLTWKKDAKTILGAPLFSNRGNLMGIIYSTKAREYTFDIDDISLIQGVANQAAVALENTQLLQESLERERLEHELKVARDVQKKLLPQKLPKISNFELEAFCLSAYEVGGDYYDFFRFADGKPGLIIGDVSGKGTSAALYMAEFKGIIQTLAQNHTDPQALASDTNRIIYPNIERNSFVSAIFAKIDPENKQLTFARAGHTPVLFCSSNGKPLRAIMTKGLGLGLDSGAIFDEILEQEILHLKEKGIVLFYTDGVTEARNESGEEYGEERLYQLIQDCKNKSAEEIKDILLNAVVDFCGKTSLHDDLTFIILKSI
ncbi:MAG: SpoIIE family protein phosphatase [Calditrichota bacterium]